tara:strand:+ start:884 stop:1267 length:384 start_codon:yes stop_codon:yes gene_type:complete
MKYEIFLRLIMTYKKAEENARKYHEFGIDLHEGKYPIAPYLYDLMIAGFESAYNEDGIDWISWFIFENEYGHKVWGNIPTMKDNGDGTCKEVESDGFGASDKDGNPIAYSYESLWNMLEAEYQIKTN